MYNEHFGLQRAPFRITPDTKLFYPGGSRGEVLEALIYAVTSGEGIVKVVGEVGSGKTMLCRMLEERLSDTVDIVYLANPSLSPEDTLHAIAMEMKLDVAPDANRLQVMQVLQEHLLRKHADNRQVVVFIEEAQSMPIATLEEIRLLSNLETNRDKLLQIVLFGQPELDENLEQADIRQLKERITHSFYLQPFTAEQMREYVNFRMRAVGYRGPDIFRGAAYRRLAKASEGLTRRINILADKALLAAFAEDTFDVGQRHVKIAINDSQFVRKRRWGLPELSLISGIVLIVAAVGWTFLQRSDAFNRQLVRLLPGGTAESGSQAALAPQPADDAAHTAAVHAATSDTAAAAPGGAAGQGSAGESPSGASNPVSAQSEVAAASGTTAPAARGSQGGVAQADAGSGTRAVVAPTRVAMPSGGSRLMLSDSLSHPPPSEAPAHAARAAQSTLAISDEDAAASGASEASSVVAMSDTPAAAPDEGTQPGGDSASTAAPGESAWVPVGEGAGPLTRARLAATRDWLASADSRHFSIQLLLTDFARRANLEHFLRERQALGEVDDYYVFETRIRSNLWYGVLYKEYASFAAAKAALEQLPEEFRYHQPFIRNVRDIATLG